MIIYFYHLLLVIYMTLVVILKKFCDISIFLVKNLKYKNSLPLKMLGLILKIV